MHVGDHWIVYIPQEVGYGSRGNGSIPGYSTLIFEMELVAIM
jgi:FKBP-type peptidyl-prolyl cis-trans isomerase